MKRNSNISLHSKWLLYQHDKKEKKKKMDKRGERNKLTRIDLSGVLHLEQNRKKKRLNKRRDNIITSITVYM